MRFLLLLILISQCWNGSYAQTSSTNGKNTVAFEGRIIQLMKEYDVPGGVIGFTENKKVTYLKGFGVTNKEHKTPTQVISKFRIASISKPITAIGILKLIENNKLKLTDTVVELLRKGGFPVETIKDQRWHKITVEDLLYHSGGWIHNDTNDPMFSSKHISRKLNTIAPPNSKEIITYMFKQALDYDPGTRYAYSNFGYNLLGRIIEVKTGMLYGDYIQQAVLNPLGISETLLGKTRLEEKFENETRYYDFPKAVKVNSVFSNNDWVTRPYGGFYLEAMDSHGGWISTAEDALKIINQLESILKKESIDRMLSPPSFTKANTNYYAMGWNVAMNNKGKVYWHTGSLPGTLATLVKLSPDVSFVAIFNSRDRGFAFLNVVNDEILDYLEE